jgi:hypothetical protein
LYVQIFNSNDLFSLRSFLNYPYDENIAFQFWKKFSLPFKGRAGGGVIQSLKLNK